MKCPNCDTVNEDNAKFCKTCGINLQVDHTFEENNEKEKIHTPTVENNVNYQQSSNNTNTNNNGGSSDWWICCICLVAIFIVFAIFSSF